MRPVFTAHEMRACDAAAVERYGIPSLVLMENAARGAADILDIHLGPLEHRRAVIVCGKGNNGGDGLALARHLLNRGMRVEVLIAVEEHAISGDAARNLAILRSMLPGTSALSIAGVPERAALPGVLDSADVIVDALFGSGLSSPLRDEHAGIVDAMNASPASVLALDLPSGIACDTGNVLGTAVRARWTAAMGGLKRGLLFGEGRRHSGDVRTVDIGMPVHGFLVTATHTFLAERRDVAAALPRRAFDAHKYSAGAVFGVAGSPGLTGAAAMAMDACMRTGAGIAKLGIPRSLNAILESKLTEVMTIPLEETGDATFALANEDRVLELFASSDAGLIGPGISRTAETLEFARRIIRRSTVPLVVDADALFALADHPDVLRNAPAPRVLTPHRGEFARLTGLTPSDSASGIIDAARAFAVEYGCVLHLKGAPSLTATKDGTVVINGTGNEGMATAGAGDVLTGVIAGLLAQGLAPDTAAWAGAWVHGAAGDRAAGEIGMHGMTATDILSALPAVMRDFARNADSA